MRLPHMPHCEGSCIVLIDQDVAPATALLRVPTQPGKPGILLFTFPGLENAYSKSGKNRNFNLKPENKIWKFYVFRFIFQDIISRKINHLHLCHIYVINTNNDLKPN